jgi:uncharacterized protein
MPAWSVTADGLMVTVRLTPKAGRDAIDGVETMSDGRAVLSVRVRALPMDGEANAALGRVLAKAVGVPSSRVALTSGATSRIKRMKIVGDATALGAALEKVAATR